MTDVFPCLTSECSIVFYKNSKQNWLHVHRHELISYQHNTTKQYFSRHKNVTLYTYNLLICFITSDSIKTSFDISLFVVFLYEGDNLFFLSYLSLYITRKLVKCEIITSDTYYVLTMCMHIVSPLFINVYFAVSDFLSFSSMLRETKRLN